MNWLNWGTVNGFVEAILPRIRLVHGREPFTYDRLHVVSVIRQLYVIDGEEPFTYDRLHVLAKILKSTMNEKNLHLTVISPMITCMTVLE